MSTYHTLDGISAMGNENELAYDVLHGNNVLEKITERSTGNDVNIDPADPEFVKFVTWALNQGQLDILSAIGGERLPPRTACLTTIEEVIKYCKANACILGVYTRFGHDIPILASGQGGNPSTDAVLTLHDGDLKTQIFCGGIAFRRLVRIAPISDGQAVDPTEDIRWSPMPVFVSSRLESALNKELQYNDSEVRKVSSWPVEKTFVYVDVSGFSKHSVGEQLLIINSLIYSTCNESLLMDNADREANLCIGDGYIFVFRTAEKAVWFAGFLAALIEQDVADKRLLDFHFRMSVHTGPVYRFWDRGTGGVDDGRWNYIGKGITDGQRVLSAIGKDRDDIVFVSAETRQKLLTEGSGTSAASIVTLLSNRGTHMDKHDVPRRLYELNHMQLAGEYASRIRKVD